MASNPAVELASTLQSASLKRNPSPHHDVNPPTTTSNKASGTARIHHHQDTSPPNSTSAISSSSSPEHIVSSSSADGIEDDTTSISISTRHIPRRSKVAYSTALPPLPDLRFEQSYLSSIRHAHTWSRVAYITARDQVLLPLAQGVGWNLVLFGWRYWNRGVKFGGQSWGSKVRRWWWELNSWQVPGLTRTPVAANTGKGFNMAEAEEFYVAEFGSGLGD